MTQRKLIESENFTEIIPQIDKEAAREKGPGRPPYWEMIFWWTRKPLISARAFTAAALLPEDVPMTEFKRMVRLTDNTRLPHNLPPITNGRFKEFTILDPFAGFGSIPLEAKRLGVGKVIASDLLPTAYIFLKAVLEYPKYGKKLVEDVKKYGEEMLKSIEENVKELYGDTTGYVGTWEVKCPRCGNYTPLVNQWWLLKLDKGRGKGYERLVYMEHEVHNNGLRIRVVDLNKELNKETIEAKVNENVIKLSDGKKYKVPEGNIEAKNSYARCLICNNVFSGKGDKWYVKEALREWNENYERFLNGEITLGELRSSRARPKLLVKFKGKSKDLDFEEITDDDEKMFWDSFEKLKEVDINKIPIENLAPYGTIRVSTWGTDKFFKMFNARQLIIFSKVVDYLNKLYDENNEYKKAVLTYLAIAFLNHISYNSFFTSVHPSRTFLRSAGAFRGIGFKWNWVEINPLADVIGSLRRSLDHVIEGLEYLIETNSDSKIEVLNVDVNELNLSEKVDAIVTDPPFADDVAYPELSDFYYVWLKRVIPMPYNTQWEEFVPKDIGVDKGRAKIFGNNVGTYEDFREKLAKAFRKLSSFLKDDGILVTFYNHTSTEAWVSLLYAGWYYSKFKITAVHAVTTEDETRITAQNTTISLDKSMVIVWRKKAEGQKLLQEVRKEAISTVSDYVSTMVQKGKLKLSTDTYIEVLGKVLSVFTKYEKLVGLKGEREKAVEELITNHVYPATVQSIIEGLSKGVGVTISDPYAAYYILVKLLIPRPEKGVRKIDKTSLTLFSLTGNLDFKDLQDNGIVKADKDSISLAEPNQGAKETLEVISELEKLLDKKALLGDYNFSNPVQVFHYLEYIALKSKDKLKEEIEKLREKTRFVDEALAIAKIFAKVLDEKDVEKEPSKRISGEEKTGILRWTK